MDKLREALASFNKLVDEREKALAQYRDADGEVGFDQLRYYDEAQTDFALDIAEAGEQLAAAVAEFIGK